MTLNNHSPVVAGLGLRIPSVPAVLSHAPKPPIRICSRCGAVLPPDLPFFCGHCRLALGQRTSDEAGLTPLAIQRIVGQFRQVSPICVSCPMSIDISRVGSTVYCNVCRMRLAGAKPKPTRRINPIVTTMVQPQLPPPPPSVIPDTRPIRAPAYPSFFNSRGELVAPPPPPSTPSLPITVPSVPRAMRDAAPVRVCMRFGCGLRLGPNPLYNFCNECLRLGFGRKAPTPPPPLKRRPKRIKRDEPPAAALPSKVQRDLDSARGAETLAHAPCGKPLERGAGDDDLHLELKYPEDEELVVQNSPDLANRVSDAVVRSESALGSGRSPLLPLTLSTSIRPRSSRPLKRICETPECGGTVPPSATWPRCHKCSLWRWKERQRAAIAACASVDVAPPTVSERESKPGEVVDGHMPTSPEANEVDRMSISREPAVVTSHSPEAPSNAIDKTSLLTHPNRQVVADSGASVGMSGRFDPECGRDTGVEYSKVSIPGWDSDLTDLSSEDEDAMESDSSAKSDTEDSSMIKIRIPVLVSRLPNARVCAIKRCNIALSPDYRWKICDSCRRYQRRYQMIRLEKRRRMESLQHKPADSCKPEISVLEAQNKEKTLEGSRLCAIPRCRARLPENNSRWKRCQSCRMRARDNSRRSSVGNLVGLEDPVEQSSSSGTSSYPPFQNRRVLLLEFSAMLERFVEAQILYLRAQLEKVGEKALPKLDPVLFTFNGEYSTVTGQRGHHGIDGPPKSGAEKSQEAVMHDEVASVVEELSSVLLTEFKPSESLMFQSGGVVARYKCGLELLVPLRPLPKAKDTNTGLPLESDTPSSHVPYVKPMSGELEVTTVPDDSHHLLLGRRTSIRLRLLG